MSQQQKDPLVIHLTNVRLSFPSLHEKSAMKGKDPEKDGSYKANFLLHKTKNAKTIAEIRAAIALLTKEEFNGKALESAGLCLKEAASKEYDGYDEDHLVISASNRKQKPGIVDNNLQEIHRGDAADPYAGCYVNATIKLYAQNGKSYKPDPSWGKKILATLRNVQVLTRQGKPYGEAFGERLPDAASEFTAVPDAENVDEV